MKRFMLLLFIISFKFCFGQSDYVVVEKTEKFVVGNRTNNTSIDSINNFTNVKLYTDDKIKLLGKWYDFNYTKYKHENIITHCPVLVDENNAILEIGIFDTEFHRVFTGDWDYKAFNRHYHRRVKKVNGEIISFQINKVENFSLYKVKMPSRYNKDVFFTSYHLIGEKNKKIYRMVLYNMDETNFENFENFLINTFNNN
jgi:hypothetical protein